MPKKRGNIKLPKFILKIEDPHSYEVQLFSYHTESDELPIMQIMNAVAFDEEKGEKFDSNFISILSKEKEDFEYYVQRLLGVEIESENEPKSGKIWVPYINNKREDWSYLCENNRIVAKEDDILWRYERYLSRDNLQVNGLDRISHDDLSSGG